MMLVIYKHLTLKTFVLQDHCFVFSLYDYTIFQPEGNLFVDRMKSLEKRNIMEPRQEAK